MTYIFLNPIHIFHSHLTRVLKPGSLFDRQCVDISTKQDSRAFAVVKIGGEAMTAYVGNDSVRGGGQRGEEYGNCKRGGGFEVRERGVCVEVFV
jgi:hypothetical protein